MEKELLVSKYKNNCTAKKSKVFLCSLLNYFLLFVLSFIITVAIANPIATSLPVAANINSTLKQTTSELAKMVGKTRIQEYSEEAKSLISVDYTKKEYLTALCKTSLYMNDELYNGEEVKVEDTFILTDYTHDNISYYYQVVKLDKEQYDDLSSYMWKEIDYSTSKENRLIYQYVKIMDYTNSVFDNYFITQDQYDALDENYKVGSRFKILSLEYAKYLRTYLLYETTGGIEETTYSYLSSSYYSAVERGKNEIENNLKEYVSKNQIVTDCAKRFTVIYILTNTISYTLVFAILYLLVPLLMKRNKYENVGTLILKLGICSSDEMEPKLSQYIIYVISKFLIGYSTIMLSFAFTGIIRLSGINFGSFSFFGLLLGCLGYGLLNLIFIFLNKKHQDFALFTASLMFRDKNEFEGKGEEEINVSDSK